MNTQLPDELTYYPKVPSTVAVTGTVEVYFFNSELVEMWTAGEKAKQQRIQHDYAIRQQMERRGQTK